MQHFGNYSTDCDYSVANLS